MTASPSGPATARPVASNEAGAVEFVAVGSDIAGGLHASKNPAAPVKLADGSVP